MNDIEKIEIEVDRLTNKIEMSIFPSTLKCYCKSECKNIKEEDILHMLDIICLWDCNKKMREANIIDSEKYKIKIYTPKGIDIYLGIGNNTKGYYEFLDLINKYYE